MTQAEAGQRENTPQTIQRALLALYHGSIGTEHHSDSLDTLAPIWQALQPFAPQSQWRYDDHETHSFLLQWGSLEKRFGAFKDFTETHYGQKAIAGVLLIAKCNAAMKNAVSAHGKMHDASPLVHAGGEEFVPEVKAALAAVLAVDNDEFWFMSDDVYMTPSLQLTDCGNAIAKVFGK